MLLGSQFARSVSPASGGSKKGSKESTKSRQTLVGETPEFAYEPPSVYKASQDVAQHVFSWLGWTPSTHSKCFETLHTHFPGSIPGRVVHSRSLDVLEQEPFNCTPENTLYGNSVCPDEINHMPGGLPEVMKDYWGKCFPLGGISGAPFSGKTGFGAFSAHVPKDGNIIVLFGPHVGISEEGVIGKHLRQGQDHASTACGAAIGAYNCCKEGAYDDSEFDQNDLQMAWIKAQIAPHAERLSKTPNPMAALAYQAFEMVRTKLNSIVNCNFSNGYLILIGGIQINMPFGYEDHFQPLTFEIRSKDQPTQTFLETFTCQIPQSMPATESDQKLSNDRNALKDVTGPGKPFTVQLGEGFDFLAESEEDMKHVEHHHVFAWLKFAPPVASPCYQSLHKYFPGAISSTTCHSRTRIVCESFGFDDDNTLFGTSICPDEINHEKGDLADLMKEHWGEVFPLGGIGGAPFAGATGFKAFSAHVPDDGNILMLFGPHVAISEAGEIGKYLRHGQANHSTACGAVIGAYDACSCAGYKTDPNVVSADSVDMQMEWIKAQLAPNVDSLKSSENPMAACAYEAYEMVKNKVLRIVNNDFGSGYLALVGGIQINMPAPGEDHFLPLMFEIRRRGEAAQELTSVFKCPQSHAWGNGSVKDWNTYSFWSV